LSLKEQFSILPSTSKSSTHLEKIYEKLWDLIYDIQTRKIEGNLQLYSWTDSFGTHSIVLTPQEVNSLLYTYSLPALHGKNYYDMRRITTGSTRTKLRFEELSAMKHFNTFKDRMFSTFQYFYDSGILAPAQSLYFQVHSSKLVENPYYNGISGYQTLKVSDGLSSLGNELSIAKLYVSILAGYSIKLSTSTDFENDLITEFSRAGCKIIEGETVFEALFRLKINKDLHRFFADTSVVRTLMLNSVHLRIPYTTVNTFFDVLFGETSLARQSSTIYQYIDFKKLDYLITTKADNIRKLTWKYFKANVGVTAATKNLKITTAYQLELFIKSIFYDPNNINNLVTFKANYDYDLSIQNMNTWKIIEDFNSVLYFNKYLV